MIMALQKKKMDLGKRQLREQLIGNFSTLGDFHSANILIYRHEDKLIISSI